MQSCIHNFGKVIKVRFQSQHVRFVSAKDHYEVLGVNRSATSKQIRKKFIELSKKLHPDVNKKEGSHELFVRVNEANSVLSNPVMRQQYDSSLHWKAHYEHQMKTPSPGSGHASCFDGPESRYYSGEYENYYWQESQFHRPYSDTDSYTAKAGQKIPKAYIALACVLFLIGSSVVHYMIFKYSRRYLKARLDRQSQMNAVYSTEAREAARTHGKDYQIQQLISRMEANRKPSSSD